MNRLRLAALAAAETLALLWAPAIAQAQVNKGIEGCMTIPRKYGGCGSDSPSPAPAPASSSRGGTASGAAAGRLSENLYQGMKDNER